MKMHSLRTKLLVIVAVLVISSGLIITSIVTYRFSRSLFDSTRVHAEHLAHQMALGATDKILINDLVALQKILDHQMRSNPSLGYLFVERQGDVLAHTFSNGFPVALRKVNEATAPNRGSVKRIVSEDGQRFIDVAWPIFEGKAGIMRVGFSESVYRGQVKQLALQMFALTLGILVAAMVLSQMFLRRVTGPITTLAEAAKKVEESCFDVQIPVKRRDEIGILTEHFNEMVLRIKDHTGKLEENTCQLDRAYKQTRNSFAIVQEIAVQPDLDSVCSYLIRKFQKVVACHQMAMVTFLHTQCVVLLTTQAGTGNLKGMYDAVYAAVKTLDGLAFAPRNFFNLPEMLKHFDDPKRLVVCPVQHEKATIGALIIGCGGHCKCDRKGLDVIELIYRQTSGTIHRAIRQESEIRNLQARVEKKAEFGGIIGKAPQMRMIYSLIEDVAPTDATVLIEGESGTGKELIAHALHMKSDRRDNAFVVINCSAYPPTLLESELFGHEKGAFTGALRRKPGRFEQANGGTVFLDEIGEIEPSAQVKLLRVLQTQSFERIGGEESIHVDIRILVATNKDLLQEVRDGHFREDLFYRLNVIPIFLPPLRERTTDIPLLARYFLKRFAKEQDKPVATISSAAMQLMLEYRWPGNVRELENSIEHAVVLAKDAVLQASDLPTAIKIPPKDARRTRAHRQTIAANEKKLLEDMLAECGWNKKKTALRLGISRSTLYNKIKKHQIKQPTVH